MHKHGQKQYFRAGATIFRAGDPGKEAYLIDRGCVEISIETDIGKKVLNNLTSGDIFGEMAIIDSSPRSATVTATEETELLVISQDYFLDKVATTDPILKHFLQILLRRLRHVEEVADRRDIHSSHAPGQSRGIIEDVTEFEVGREQVRYVLRMQKDMLEGLKRDEFKLYYQPIVRLATGEIAGFEALIRWENQERGLLQPSTFIGASEETGFIVPLGSWIFETACRATARFQQVVRETNPAMPLPYISINLSYRQFFDDNLTDLIADCISKNNLKPEHVTAEVTETLFISDPITAESFLNRLKKLGIRIAVDDFGTGYASLNYLYRFPLDTLKVDQTFVRALDSNDKSCQIVKALADLARNLGMDVIAEGVCGLQLAQWTKQLGCTYGQGYHFARPLPEEQAIELLASGTHWVIDVPADDEC